MSDIFKINTHLRIPGASDTSETPCVYVKEHLYPFQIAQQFMVIVAWSFVSKR